MKIEKYGFVYIWYDRKHKRYYIGSHWGREDDGYVCSSVWMKQAYRHHPESFRRKIVSRVYTSRTDMLAEEQRWLDMMDDDKMTVNIPDTNGRKKGVRYYNISKTAQRTWHYHEESRKTVGERISASKKGKNTGPRDPSVGAKISATKKGKTFTDEHRKALSDAHAGKTLSEEHRRKIGEAGKGREGAWLGKTFTEDHRAKLSVAAKGRPGRPHSDETRAKISANQLGKTRKPHSEETKAKMADARRRHWESRKAVA